MWLIWSLALLSAYLAASTALSLATNYAAARRTGLPLVVSPVSKLNPLWLLAQRRLAPWMRRNLPSALTSWTRHNTLSWFFDDKYLLFSELGGSGSRTWLHVTPGELELHCADPAVSAQVFGRRADFDKPAGVLHLVDIYGPNISSVTGAEWRRHRRVTASPFNERNNRRVWDEALRQAGQAAACWSARGAAGFNTTVADTVAVSLNILATAALGESWDFCPADERSSSGGGGDGDGQASSYRECLHVLLGSVRTLAVTPKWVYRLPGWCIPSGYLSRFVETRRVFGRHMEDMVAQRKAEIASGDMRTDDSTFLSALILRSEEVRREEEGGAGKGEGGGGARAAAAGLSNDELYGNLFTYNLAGHETTANSLSFAIYLLAAFPEWQEWVREEVDAVYTVSADGEVNTAYEDVFPNLKRCRAFLVGHSFAFRLS